MSQKKKIFGHRSTESIVLHRAEMMLMNFKDYTEAQKGGNTG